MKTQKSKELYRMYTQEKKLQPIIKGLSNEPSKCLDFGKTTRRVTSRELDGGDTSRSLKKMGDEQMKKRMLFTL